jgi:3-oxoadipate enol-lactonase
MTAQLRHDIHGRDDAPVLVLAPSVGTQPAVWDQQLPVLAQHWRVIRVAHRGHDARDVPTGPYSLADLGGDVLALLDSLEVRRFSWCGLSLGAMVGMWIAAHSDRVERLALCCTSAHLAPSDAWTARAEAVRSGGMAAVADPVVARWFTPEFATARPDVVAAARRMFLSVPPEGYAGCCEAIAGMDLRADLAGIRAPTLVLAASADEATPVSHGRLIAELVPGAALAVVEGAHLATVEAPTTTTQLLLEHLGGGHESR